MPTYEYECLSCEHEFELFQKMSDPPCEVCPKCEKKVRKKIGAGAGLIFKGSGFYITDYRSEAYKKQAKAEGGDSGGGGNAGDSSAAPGPSKEKGKGSGDKSSAGGSGSKGSEGSGSSGGTKGAD